jgi:hypothetical protein
MQPVYVTYDTLADALNVSLYVGVQEEELPKRHHARKIDLYRHLETTRTTAGLDALKKTLGLVLVS